MHIVKDDIWEYLEKGWHIIVPTNGHVNKDGKAVMGKGIAYQAKMLIGGMETALGNLIKKHGNHVFYFERQKLITFPTKHHWKQPADIDLIAESCEKLKVLMKDRPNIKVAMPKVGCGNGKLEWDKVASIIQANFGQFPESRFLIVDNEQADAGTEWRGKNVWNKKGTDKVKSPFI